MRLIGFRTQADFLDLDLGLRPLGFAFLLSTFVNELAIVDHAADGRTGVGGYFHKVQIGVAGDLQGLSGGNDTDVAAVGSDQTDFRGADALIDSKFCSADKFLLFQNS